jgi:hypothetical protein
MAKFLDLTGQRYGRLTVIARSPEHRLVYWMCQCDCGGTKTVFAGSLRRGLTKSCGCLSSETTATRNTVHGLAQRSGRAPEYQTWAKMRRRCENPIDPVYHRYGARGIKVCDRWQSFAAFLEDMGPRPTPQHTIERVNNDGNYEPGNCRWADRTEQANNRRTSRILEHNGEALTVAEWARRTGLRQHTIMARIDRNGWSVERALTTPPRFNPRYHEPEAAA